MYQSISKLDSLHFSILLRLFISIKLLYTTLHFANKFVLLIARQAAIFIGITMKKELRIPIIVYASGVFGFQHYRTLKQYLNLLLPSITEVNISVISIVILSLSFLSIFLSLERRIFANYQMSECFICRFIGFWFIVGFVIMYAFVLLDAVGIANELLDDEIISIFRIIQPYFNYIIKFWM